MRIVVPVTISQLFGECPPAPLTQLNDDGYKQSTGAPPLATA